MQIYTSYFYQVRFMKPCMVPLSTFDVMPYDEIDNYTNERLNILLDLYNYLLSFEE